MPPPYGRSTRSGGRASRPPSGRARSAPSLIEVRDGAAYVNGKRVLSVSELRDSESEGLTQRSG